ncbi:ribonuclease [Pseudahrensia aquimaris]|uniref:Ribonuclease n=1 Tax=Pseudahrensia aquimaris TaxID=744461 RepID=A0ABW3FF62_9HYPH
MLRHVSFDASARRFVLTCVLALCAILALSACQRDVLKVDSGEKPAPQVVEAAPAPQEPISDEEAALKEVENSTVDDSAFRAETVPAMALVLAMSWQPGFCETRPKKSECQSQTADRYDANHFTLHGLWPQPRSKVYCGVSKTNVSRDKNGNWLDLPAVQTSVATKARLDRIMPGTRSSLDRHEWIKHGTCYSRTAETYYRDSLALMDKINTSAVQRLFSANIGQTLNANQIRAAFDDSFGRGTGERVRVACKRDGNRLLITELTLGLNGVVGADPDIGRLASRSRPISAGCPGGIVDPVGLQ